MEEIYLFTSLKQRSAQPSEKHKSQILLHGNQALKNEQILCRSVNPPYRKTLFLPTQNQRPCRGFIFILGGNTEWLE